MTRVTQAVFCLLSASVLAAAGADTLTWEECVSLAADNSPSLAAARARVDAADASVGAARSGYLPQLSVGASADHSGNSSADSETDVSYGASFDASQSLYKGGETRARVDSARSALNRAAASAAGEAATVTFNLRRSFVNLLHAQEQLNLTREIEARRRDNLELVELRHEGGREHSGSLAMSRAAHHEAEVDVVQAERQVAIARDSLSREIGSALLPATTRAEGSLDSRPVPDVADWTRLARNTPALAEATASLAAAEARLRQARAGYQPDLALSGSAGRYGSDGDFEDDRWSVRLRLSYPFWPGGSTAHEVRQARASLDESTAALDQTLRKNATDIETAHGAFADASEGAEVQRRYLEAAEARAAIARQQYEDGMLGFENWDIIENDLIGRRKRLLDSRRSLALAEAAWQRAIGISAFGGSFAGERHGETER
ncbi:MAG: TolC family protein [Lentisphaerae bacterium]|nr:TolC family protein [Lentisphaerota bacterium]